MIDTGIWKKNVVLAMISISLASTFLVGGYEFLRTVSISLFINAYGSDRIPYVKSAVPVVLAALIYIYGICLTRLGPLRTMVMSSFFSALVFILCFVSIQSGSRAATAILFIYREAYIVLLVEQFWSLINSTLTPVQAKAFNGPICGGASLGPVAAGYMVHRLAQTIGSEAILLLGAAALIPASLLAFFAFKLAGEPQPAEDEKGGAHGPLNLRLLTHSRTLFLLALAVGLAQVISVVFELNFYNHLQAAIPNTDARTAYLGGFWSAANVGSAVLQFIIAPLLLRSVPLRFIHLGIPAIHIASSITLLAFPTLFAASASFLLFKSFDYSIFRAAKEVLYVPLSFDARYRAKQVIDAFTYRFTNGGTAFVIALVTSLSIPISILFYPIAALISALSWASIALPMASGYKDPSEEKEAARGS